MSAEILLNQLHKVRKNGPGKWMACCSAHDDKSPSLSVKECSDGHILVHCFAGCSAQEVMESVGLTMSDLMPERDAHYFDDRPPQWKPQPPDLKGRELEISKLEFRIRFYTDLIKSGTRLPEEDNKALREWYARLTHLKKGVAV